MNSLDRDGGISSKNAQRIKAIKDATFGGSNSVSPPRQIEADNSFEGIHKHDKSFDAVTQGGGDYDKYYYKYGNKNESPGVTPIMKETNGQRTSELPSIIRRKDPATPSGATYPIGI